MRLANSAVGRCRGIHQVAAPDRLLFALLYDTGIRIGEALGLRHEDIAAAEREITIRRRVNSNIKFQMNTHGQPGETTNHSGLGVRNLVVAHV